MADTFKYVQSQATTLAGAGASLGATSVILSSLLQIDGSTTLTMTNFGTIGFGTIEPGGGTNEEQISFTGITQNANGTATLTGVKTVLFISPYTQTSGLANSHAGGTTFVISNTAGFYDQLTSKGDDETVTGIWTFTAPNYPKMDSAAVAPTDNEQLATKKYVDDTAFAGAPNASLTVKGISEEATAAEINSGTQTGGTGAELFVNPFYLAASNYATFLPTTGQKDALVGNNTDVAVGTGNKYVTQTGLQHNAEKYAADAQASDTYVITLSPVPTSYTNGMVVYFKANTVNTGAATINVNSLGAKTIVKGVNTTLANGDIAAGQFCTIIYDGTNFVLQNPTTTSVTGGATYSSASTLTFATGQTSAKMGGFAGTITPVKSGNILITIIGDCGQDTALDGFVITARYGTGSAPSGGDAASGTTLGGTVTFSHDATSAAINIPVTVGGLASGLTLGTAYWIDIALNATVGGTATCAHMQITAIEL